MPKTTILAETIPTDIQPMETHDTTEHLQVDEDSSPEAKLWATITPQQDASLRALHESIQKANQLIGSKGDSVDPLPSSEETPEPIAAPPPTTTTTTTTNTTIIAPTNKVPSPTEVIIPISAEVGTPPVSAEGSVAPETPPSKETEGESEKEKPPVGSPEWHKLRRENHKQVERRRRETINDGINEISRIVPGCEKNKGSILQRAATYIRQLKEAEATTVEKWTLEKLLTDQAIKELNRQVEALKTELDHVRVENTYLKRQLEESSAADQESAKKQKTTSLEE